MVLQRPEKNKLKINCDRLTNYEGFRPWLSTSNVVELAELGCLRKSQTAVQKFEIRKFVYDLVKVTKKSLE